MALNKTQQQITEQENKSQNTEGKNKTKFF